MKVKIFNALCKKAYNRLNKTREWASQNSGYSTQPLVSTSCRKYPDARISFAGSYLCNTSTDSKALTHDRLELSSSLKDSAVARLLLEGRLPPSDPVTIPGQQDEGWPVGEPSSCSSLQASSDCREGVSVGSIGAGGDVGVVSMGYHSDCPSPDPSPEKLRQRRENSEKLQLQLAQDMVQLKDCSPMTSQIWKCRYCPYTASSATVLYSHYQFHMQLLTSQSSQPHVEWMMAYCSSREGCQEATYSDEEILSLKQLETLKPAQSSIDPSSSPSKDCTAPAFTSLPFEPASSSPNNSFPSASGFLRSFVQAVMQKGDGSGERQTSSTIYASLVKNSLEKSTLDSTQYGASSPKRFKFEEIKQNATTDSPQCFSQTNSKDIWDHPIDMSVNKPLVKTEPVDSFAGSNSPMHSMQSLAQDSRLHANQCDGASSVALTPSPEYDSPYSPQENSSDKISVGSPSDYLAISADSGIHDIASQKDFEGESSTFQERKRSFSNTIAPATKVCNGAFAPRKMLMARSRKTHRSSSMESLSSLDSSNFSISASGSSKDSIPQQFYKEESSNPHDYGPTPLPSPIHTALASNMSTQCSLLMPHDSTEESNKRICDVEELARMASETRCPYCDIEFGDEVLHSIHMGCHNHTHPFVCNMCGKQCGNKYTFYTHIMRGHNP